MNNFNFITKNEEIENLKKFLDYVFEQIFEGDPDGGDLQDKAHEMGILIPIKLTQAEIGADPEKYANYLEYDTDTLFYPYWSEEVKRQKDE